MTDYLLDYIIQYIFIADEPILLLIDWMELNIPEAYVEDMGQAVCGSSCQTPTQEATSDMNYSHASLFKCEIITCNTKIHP